MINGLIDRGVKFLVWNISDFFCAPVQERFEPLCNCCPILRRVNLMRRDSDDTDFFVGLNPSSQELFDGRLHVR